MQPPLARIALTAQLLACLWLFTGPAKADDTSPSFDCKKAASAIEKLICADAFLGFRDGALGKLYRALVASPNARPDLKAEIRHWLRERNRTCGRARSRDKMDACLTRSYETMLRRLSRRMTRAKIGPAARGLPSVSGRYGKKIKFFAGSVTVVEMPDLTAWVEINTVNGPTYHICNLFTGSARRVGATLVWRDKDQPKCEVTLHFKGRTVNPKATPACRTYYCGARGAFMDLEYRR